MPLGSDRMRCQNPKRQSGTEAAMLDSCRFYRTHGPWNANANPIDFWFVMESAICDCD